jgi:hypothetical protein
MRKRNDRREVPRRARRVREGRGGPVAPARSGSIFGFSSCGRDDPCGSPICARTADESAPRNADDHVAVGLAQPTWGAQAIDNVRGKPDFPLAVGVGLLLVGEALAASWGAAERRLTASNGTAASGTLPEPKVCAGCAQVLWTPVCDIGYMLAILGRAKGHDHQAACGPSRLGAYVVRLCAFANWRSCRWHDRTRGHRSPLVQRTSLLSLRLGMASSPLRGLVYTVRLWSLIGTGAAARRGSQARRLAPHARLRR